MLNTGSIKITMCVLASGSSGNCIVIGSDSTFVLIDTGLSRRETIKRLEQIGIRLSDIKGICLTHEHSDHIAGLNALHKHNGISLYANSGTVEGVRMDPKQSHLKWNVFTTGAPFQIGDLTFDPFAVSHDAYEPVGFVVTCGKTRIGIVTDIGLNTHLVREHLRHCQALALESNHDEQLLSNANRPWHLKQRIAGRQGHLSNRHTAEMVTAVAGPELIHVFLCHLSAQCNRPELALNTTLIALQRQGFTQVQVKLTFQDKVSEIWSHSFPDR